MKLSDEQGKPNQVPFFENDFLIQNQSTIPKNYFHCRVLGGIVLILFFVALSTCIKHRRNVNAFGVSYGNMGCQVFKRGIQKSTYPNGVVSKSAKI